MFKWILTILAALFLAPSGLLSTGCLLERLLPQQEPEPPTVSNAIDGLIDALDAAWPDILDDIDL